MSAMISDVLVQGDIQFNRVTHEYLHLPTKKKLTSVTTVVKAVYNKKSWDGVDESVVENARERGIKVDDYIAEYMTTGVVTMPEGERQDVVDRVIIAHKLIEENYGNRISCEPQKIVYNLDLGIAGMCDLPIDNEVVDLKVTYSPEVDWAFQIGAYAEMGDYASCAILHISPRFYKDTVGGRLLRYDVEQCKGWWREAVAWWLRTKEIENAQRKKEGVRLKRMA